MANNNNNKETLKTIGGVVLIAIIVVATFLYGNKQRQQQLQKQTASQESQQGITPNNTGSTSMPSNDVTVNPAPGGGSVTVGEPNQNPTPAGKTPETGAGDYLIPLALLAGLYQAYHYSRKQLAVALRR